MSAFQKWWNKSPMSMRDLSRSGVARQAWDAAIKSVEPKVTASNKPSKKLSPEEFVLTVERAHKNTANSKLVFRE